MGDLQVGSVRIELNSRTPSWCPRIAEVWKTHTAGVKSVRVESIEIREDTQEEAFSLSIC